MWISDDQWIDEERPFSSSLWFTKFRKLTFPFPNVADTVLKPEQAWTKRRCSLSSKFEQALAILYAVSVFFELKMISDISPFQWYRKVIAMSVSSATTITGLSVLGEKKTDCGWNNCWSTSPSHWITTWPPSSKYLELSIIILVLLFLLERRRLSRIKYIALINYNVLTPNSGSSGTCICLHW